jgi:subfamily B ATP-binding cassette protein MsbA
VHDAAVSDDFIMLAQVPTPRHLPPPPTDSNLPDVVKKTLRSMWKYLFPYRFRFALSIALGMLSALFNGIMLIGFQLIFSLVLKGQTRTLGEATKLPLIGEINLADIIGVADDTPVGLTGVMIACSFIPVLIFIRGSSAICPVICRSG